MNNQKGEYKNNVTESNTPPAYWSGVFAMTLCVFVLIASEFMPVSLLTPMAQSLDVTEGMAGQGIAISGAFAVVTSLFISVLAGSLNRKILLLGLTCIMAVSGAIIAMAPNYFIYMVGRALIGIVVGGFWSMSAATAMRLVPVHRIPLALTIFNSGNALATVIAAPLGSWLGSVIGWRGAFFCLIPVAIVAFGWQLFSLPSMPVIRQRREVGNVFTLFRRRVVTLGMLGVGIFFMGQFTLFTYIRPFLEMVTKVDSSTVTLTLLVIGITGFIGTTLINKVLKRRFYLTLMAIPVAMAITALALIIFGSQVAIVIALLGLWGLISTGAPVGWWAWVPRTFPQNAEAGGGLMVAMIQLSIAFGSTVGGLLFDHHGYQSTFLASAGMLIIAAVFIFLTSRADTFTKTYS
ncbi:MFS transporter [Providencia alcalifaciens]|uniref:MFS transporter n=1 Tax=Providencia alcalifaciens TaxID=126385 RepID=UPI001CE0BE15|nr:MFS transporter [Providencia alcalifaciens]UBX49282.1 MFS transporter [Providencia alcalifaciens]